MADYTLARGDGWVEFFVDTGRHVARVEQERIEGRELMDILAAAPEMLTTLRDLRREMVAGSMLDAGNIDGWIKEIDSVLAKAEPVRTERRKVRVQVDIEVDVPRGTALDCDEVAAKVQDRVFIGMFDREEFNRDTTIVRARAVKVGELYEE